MALFTQPALVVTQIRARFAQNLSMRIATYKAVYNMVWTTPDVSPADIWAAFGSDAATVLSMQQTEQQVLNAAQPGCVPSGPPASWTATANSDGTVTAVKAS